MGVSGGGVGWGALAGAWLLGQGAELIGPT